MASEQQSNSLLHALKQLYSRVVLHLLHKRMDSYRKETGGHTDQDLATPLSDHLDRLASSRQVSQGAMPAKNSPGDDNTAGHLQKPDNRYRRPGVSVVGRALGGLSKYFRIRRDSVVLDHQVSEKLKKSTLSHIHTALRFARQGDLASAKLHAGIASQALHEAGHYLSEKEYAEFSLEVDEKLGEIRKQSRQS